jgi:hypothetical protein
MLSFPVLRIGVEDFVADLVDPFEDEFLKAFALVGEHGKNLLG